MFVSSQRPFPIESCPANTLSCPDVLNTTNCEALPANAGEAINVTAAEKPAPPEAVINDVDMYPEFGAIVIELNCAFGFDDPPPPPPPEPLTAAPPAAKVSCETAFVPPFAEGTAGVYELIYGSVIKLNWRYEMKRYGSVERYTGPRGLSGELYTSKTINGIRHVKYFKTLQEAITYRDTLIQV